MDVNKNSYTFTFAAIMVIVVAAILSFAATSLKDRQDNNVRLEKMQNILSSINVEVERDAAEGVYSEYIKQEIVVNNSQVQSGVKAFDIELKKELTKAPLERNAPLYVAEKDGKTYYIAPIRGKGLWDAIWGYVAMDENMIVQGAYFDHKGETPGLGANIKYRFFMDDFKGEHLLDASGNFKGIRVAKGNNDPKNDDKTDYEVHAIAGATITGDGVSAMIKSDLKLYVNYFKTLKQ